MTTPMTRPVQLGLMEGTDRAVGPILPSVFHGSNAELLHAVSPLYLTGSVLDVTFGRGMWWTKHRPEGLVHHDLAVDGVDFRNLPHADRSFDSVCFDPPYVPRRAGGTEIPAHTQAFRDRFGLEDPRRQSEIQELINAGLVETTRVMRRWLLVKCCDYVNDRRLHLGHIRLIAEAEQLGLRCHDLIVHATGSGPGGGQIREIKRARRAHSYLLVFERTGRQNRGPEQ